MKKAIICDIDGVIADSAHWLDIKGCNGKKFCFDSWFEANQEVTPLEFGVELLNAYMKHVGGDISVIFLTGRLEKTKDHLKTWLKKYGLPEHASGYHLMLRPDELNNYSSYTDAEYKRDAYLHLIEDKFDVILAIDDRVSIIKEYRKLGLQTLLVPNRYSFGR